MFKSALHDGNEELAERFLDDVSKSSDDVDNSGACVAESQKTGNANLTAKALQKVAEGLRKGKPDPSRIIPIVHRCIIRLQMTVMSQVPDGKHDSTSVQNLIDAFTSGGHH